MKIAIDITELYVAQAGVFYYRYKLIEAMLRLNPQEHTFLLLNYFPIHGGYLQRPEVDELIAPNASTLHLHGLRHRKLSRLWFLQKPVLEQAALMADKLFLAPLEHLATKSMSKKLDEHLYDFDVFHTSDVLQYAPPNTKTITTIHDMTTLLFPEHHTNQTKMLQMQKFSFSQEQADAILTVSESTKRDVVRLLDIDPERVHVIYEGVDPGFRPLSPEKIAPVMAKFNLQPKSYILHVGTIEPRKNLVRLIQAYHEVWRKNKTEMPKLVLAGTSGWFFREVFAQVEKLDLSEQVLFLGRIDDADLPALYNGALFLAYPTLYEGFGLPALEAMASGIPVLTSNTSSLPEVVGDAGVMIEPTDVDSIIDGLQWLVEDETYREKLSEMGLQRVQKFSWENAAKETLQLYMDA